MIDNFWEILGCVLLVLLVIFGLGSIAKHGYVARSFAYNRRVKIILNCLENNGWRSTNSIYVGVRKKGFPLKYNALYRDLESLFGEGVVGKKREGNMAFFRLVEK